MNEACRIDIYIMSTVIGWAILEAFLIDYCLTIMAVIGILRQKSECRGFVPKVGAVIIKQNSTLIYKVSLGCW